MGIFFKRLGHLSKFRFTVSRKVKSEINSVYDSFCKPRGHPAVNAVCTACSKVFPPIKLLLIYYKWPGGLGAGPVEVFQH